MKPFMKQIKILTVLSLAALMFIACKSEQVDIAKPATPEHVAITSTFDGHPLIDDTEIVANIPAEKLKLKPNEEAFNEKLQELKDESLFYKEVHDYQYFFQKDTVPAETIVDIIELKLPEKIIQYNYRIDAVKNIAEHIYVSLFNFDEDFRQSFDLKEAYQETGVYDIATGEYKTLFNLYNAKFLEFDDVHALLLKDSLSDTPELLLFNFHTQELTSIHTYEKSMLGLNQTRNAVMKDGNVYYVDNDKANNNIGTLFEFNIDTRKSTPIRTGAANVMKMRNVLIIQSDVNENNKLSFFDEDNTVNFAPKTVWIKNIKPTTNNMYIQGTDHIQAPNDNENKAFFDSSLFFTLYNVLNDDILLSTHRMIQMEAVSDYFLSWNEYSDGIPEIGYYMYAIPDDKIMHFSTLPEGNKEVLLNKQGNGGIIKVYELSANYGASDYKYYAFKYKDK